ncbi:type II toxin-antitoxin system antitoxin SocA domain-containing protein [Intestinibacter bartlettii]|uniref:DUF4065 domain-containing protein n=1 Tax=Intestinibacter bartlettii TaxID=261299 RepID=A0ABS6DV27_9FIRM|nr:type II toxin-antitoxin system antitoxin SocA domain-containing protein [Intestinibacter bartlettii]MBU5335691.1 DUF4065 domain-containing protein [Intestinibacter bartlettii]
MNKQNIAFCENCLDDTEYIIKNIPVTEKVRGHEIKYVKKETYCKECGGLVYVSEINDENLNTLYSEARKVEDLISIDKIEEIMKKYDIGKRPLSKLLGWGDLTITRYLEGFLPNKEYSDKLKLILDDADEMLSLLETNKNNISNVTYKKTIEAIKNLKRNETCIDEEYSKLIRVSKYIVSKMYDVTPLALQKLLYYSQAFYNMFTEKNLFEDDCEAWVYGPVYREVYDYYRDYKGRGISSDDDIRLDNYIEEQVVDSVIKYFGCYNTSILVSMTHLEKPWIFSRNGLDDNQASNKIIEKYLINSYFKEVKDKYNIINFVDIKDYSKDLFFKVIN